MKTAEKWRSLLCFRNLFSAGIALFSAGTAGAEPGKISANVFRSAALGDQLSYLVYLPSGYDASREARFPVVYLLHGRGNSMEAWRMIAPDLDRMIEAKQIPPVIAVMPDAPSNHRANYYIDSQATDGRPVETAITVDLVQHIDATFRTVAQRSGRIVAGYSMGGYGALRFSLAHPELFFAAIVLSPAVYFPLPPRASSTREFGAFGNGDVKFDDAIYRGKNYPAILPTFQAAGRPLVMFIAVGDDEAANADPTEASNDLDYEAHTLYNHLRRIKEIAVELRVVNGGHNWTTWRPTFLEGLIHVFHPPPPAAVKPK